MTTHDDLNQLRRFARELAQRWHEPCLIILADDAPPSGGGSRTRIGYVVLLSQATRAEKAARHERVEAI